MALPAILAGALAGLGTSISASLKFLDNPISAYFFVISLVLLDSGQSFFLNNAGVIGTAFGLIFNQLGVNIAVYSWQIAILFGLLPLIKLVFDASIN